MPLLDRARGAFDVLYREVLKFGIVGVVSFVVDMGIFNLLLRTVWHDTAQVGPLSAAVAATSVSTAVSSAVAWVGNRTWTFRHRRNRPLHHEAALFMGTNGVALVIGALCVAFSNKVLGLEGNVAAANIAKLVGIALGTLFRFWAYRRYVFAGEPLVVEAPIAPTERAVADERAAADVRAQGPR